MNIATYLLTLSMAEKLRFYAKSGTGSSYMYHMARGDKHPSLTKMLALIEASDYALTLHELRPDLLGRHYKGRKSLAILEKAVAISKVQTEKGAMKKAAAEVKTENNDNNKEEDNNA